MTQEEFDAIVAAVIAALKTNGKTIMQLTEATSVSDSDYFELHGGRRIAYSHLYENLLSEASDIIDGYTTDMTAAIDDLRSDMTTGLAAKPNFYDATWLTSGDTSSASNLSALVAAITADKLVMIDFMPMVFAQVLNSGNTVRAFTLQGKDITRYDVVKNGSSADISIVTFSLLDDGDMSSISSAISEMAGDITNIKAKNNEQDATLGQHTTAISNLGSTKANASDVYTKGQTDTLLGGKVSTGDMHNVAGQNPLANDVLTHYVEVLTMNNNVITGNLSWVEFEQLETWGVSVDLLFRDEVYKQSFSGSAEKMWTCGMKRLRLTNGDVWTYEQKYFMMPSTNVIFEGINDGEFVVGESSVSTCLNELYHVTELHNIQLAGLKEVYCTQEYYNDLVDAGTVDPDTKYFIYE